MEKGILIGSEGSIGKAINNVLKNTYDIYKGSHQKKISSHTHFIDLNHSSSIQTFFKDLPKKYYSFLIIPTGINSITTIKNYKKSDAHNVFNTNYFGVIECIQYALPYLTPPSPNHISSIVLFSSQAAITGGHNMWTYAASKAALNTSVIALAKELGKIGIRINAISPGVIDNVMQNHLSPNEKLEKAKTIPLQRFGTIEEVAKLAKWLVSKDASYISGTIIPIHGGGRI